MKDRWKIVLISVILSLTLGLGLVFLGFSFKIVELRSYGISKYDYYQTIDPDQQVRTNGNYLIGIDHSFIQYPKGLIVHKFLTKILTKDKSMIQIEGLFIGKLIYSELVNLSFKFGTQYQQFLFQMVEQLYRQAFQSYTLNQIISQRQTATNYLKNYVKLSVQTKYNWIKCNVISFGSIKNKLMTQILSPQVSIQENYKKTLMSLIQIKKIENAYTSGGFQLIQNLQKYHSNLLENLAVNLKLLADDLTASSKQEQILSALQYVFTDNSLPVLNNKVQVSIL